MNILLFAPFPPPEGGLPTWTKKYIYSAQDYKINPVLVNIALQGKRGIAITNSSTIIDEIKRTVYIIREMKYAIKNKCIDVVHINTCCSRKGILRDALCMSLCKDTPVVLHCHCNVEDWVKQIPTSIKALSWMVKRARKVIVLNRASQKFIDSIEEGKSIIVPNAIEDEFINKNLTVRKELKKIIYVGHLFEEKGITQILQASYKLKNVEIMLVGPINKKYQNMEWPSNVRAVGSVPNNKIREMLRDADAFLFPSHSEGFSVSLLEALASGLPAVATAVGANEDMIEGKGGIIIPPYNSDAIVSAIESIRDYQIRFDMATWNIEKVEREYRQAVVMSKYRSIYEEAIL